MENCDHDLLIRVETTLLGICKKIDVLSTKVDLLQDKTSTKISWKSLWGSAGVVIVIVGSIIGYNYTIDGAQWNKIEKHTQSIQQNTTDITVLKTKDGGYARH